MKAAYLANGWIPGSDGPEEWRRFLEIARIFSCFGLMGTENVKGLLSLLRDHAVEIGRKEPTSIIWTRLSSSKPDIRYLTSIAGPRDTNKHG